MTPYDHERATRELVYAMSLKPGDKFDREVRLADWAEWWGPRLLTAVAEKVQEGA